MPRPAIIIALRRSILAMDKHFKAHLPLSRKRGKSGRIHPRRQLTGKHTATNGIGGQICTGGIPGGSTAGGGGGPGAGGGASHAAGAGATTHMFVGAS
jgi:hypothetical protein